MKTTFNSAIREIRKRVNLAAGAKSPADQMKLLAQIKLFADLAIEPLKQQRNQHEVRCQIIKRALKQLLTKLDRIFDQHEELGDTDVRERMFDAVFLGFIRPKPAYSLPARFGMFTEEGNKLVRAAIQEFLAHPQVIAAGKKLKTVQERMYAFQDDAVETAGGTQFSEYFGWRMRA